MCDDTIKPAPYSTMRQLIPILAALISFCTTASRAADIPTTVPEVAAGFDPRIEPLDTHVVREWHDDGVTYRYVTFHVGTFKDQPARIAAFYAFPQDASNAGDRRLPGLLHLHGGGQRAFLHEVDYYARRGYACLSINWGGREMEKAQPGDENTDWGAVEPTQQNVQGYFNLQPGEKYLDPVDSPRNNNWYLLTLAGRRGLTFLERQPEVDPDRLGVYGHSMGGNLTIYVAGTDDRLKAAAPSVGGSGFRTQPWPLLPQQRKQPIHGDVDLFNATLGFESYAPHITVPTLWLSSTNDFHGIMDDTCRTGELIPHGHVRYAFTPHLNHRFTPEFAITRPLWIDQHLQSGLELPETPKAHLRLETDDGVPLLEVTPDPSQPIDRVHILYSLDPDPQARFWRTADAEREGDVWSARLPILSIDQPLFACANVHYRLPAPQQAVQTREQTEVFALSSLLQTATPDDLRAAHVKATDTPTRLIDDFTHGWQDWYVLNARNPHHWEFSTRKLNDPKWRGQPGWKLTLDVQSEQPNALTVVATENFFRNYRGPKKEYVAVAQLTGSDSPQTLSFTPEDFATIDGERLSSWDGIDILSVRAYYEANDQLLGRKNWKGPQPVFHQLLWGEADESTTLTRVECEGTYPHHLQGVCASDRFIYWSFTTTLVKTDRSGRLLRKVPVANHHGDLCHHDGKLYVAVNLGKFNDPKGNADSWVYVYDADTLKELARHETQEVFHGAGGIGFRNGHLYVVGGLPDGVPENYVYEFDHHFQIVKKHVVDSGHTHLGIQTATFSHDRWWFGCYGDPKILLVTDAEFLMLGRYEFDCSLGIEGWTDGRLLAAGGQCDKLRGCDGHLQIATPDQQTGLIYASPGRDTPP